MNKRLLVTAIASVIGTTVISTTSLSANAALVTGTVLEFDTGWSCPVNYYCVWPGGNLGSYFSMDTNGNGVMESGENTPIQNSGDGGIQIGITGDPALNSHPGAIDGSESPAFDIWEFFGGTGMHYLTSPITLVDDAYSGDPFAKTLDFSGWSVTWNGIPNIPMGGDTANFASDTGLAIITCSSATCSNSNTFVLDYSAHVPLYHPSGFGGVFYSLHLEGTVSAVPVPAAAWLFGSGLIGLIGVAKRKKS